MERNKKLRYRIAVSYESNHFVEADSPEEAVQIWQKEMMLDHVPYKIKAQEWIKGGFRLVLELQAHLSQEDRDVLGESISIGNVNKSGENIR
ncbi:MAG TPA: hypothetical protein V6C52_05155 [Coleofasciculaceae cyanobacterium]|jgi:hypothetical protein